jgi:L-alanine-DL-glutamate epimerase-like enolase superfamily enzyme
VAIHSWGSIVSALAGLHLALVMPNCAMTEYTFMDHPLNDRLSVERIRPKDGHIAAPTTPGLGVKFDEALLDEFPYVPSPNTMISTDETDFRLT